ncbi:8-amino-7-oxononanoate synthase [Luteimonas granuli]|uniref:8-amino-7-oxononanoate synthase n=1 Tax=Luteimonas granuli TaxID=1176533 RepID=A0A518N4E4_9GAMM|nr:8-amino-7-oxononanoate synthase [Luteimonas granuli]QDW66785.1 8-amino-7-oxononanoate synthase [Luteimonas granuli]
MTGKRPDLRHRVQARRAEAMAHDLARSRRAVGRRDGVRMEIDGRWLINFCGNDYLGLAQQFQVVDAVQGAAARDGVGGIGSHLVCGHHVAHEALEREVADWLQLPRALVFGSGYMANLAVQQALLGEGDTSVQDRLNHASLIDGARLAGCRLRRYPHGDAEGALRQLRTVPDGAAMIATDGVFSMDGDVAPLRQLALVARMQSALLYVDDAHGVGVLGPDGRGSVADARLGVAEVPLQLVTLGKALGGYGAVVAGDADLIDHLAGTARPYLYTTALPPPQAAAALASVKLARREHWRREKLGALVQRFRAGMQERGSELPPSETPIQPVPCGDNARALDMAARLEADGFRVAAIRPPTVPEGRARLRVTLCAAHAEDQVDALVAALGRARDHVDAARAA